jgi:hypothetical protein
VCPGWFHVMVVGWLHVVVVERLEINPYDDGVEAYEVSY